MLPQTGATDHYQETIIHTAMAGADAFYLFNPWLAVGFGGTRAVMADYETLSNTLSELDDAIGCDAREWVDDIAGFRRWGDDFFLTGTRVGRGASAATVWRFTPAAQPFEVELKAGPDGLNVSVHMDIRGANVACDLVFRSGSLLPARDEGVAPYGRWIVQRHGVESNVPPAVEALCDGRAPAPWPLRRVGSEVA